MALEALSSNELLNFIIYDTISATPFSTSCNDYSSETTNTTTATATATATSTNPPQEAFSSALLDHSSHLMPAQLGQYCSSSSIVSQQEDTTIVNAEKRLPPPGVQQGRKKRRRRPRVCKNKEEAETQRMTHIAVERNRRKQMNEHLAVLRSLMPESYVQRGDQASIVGGAIEFVKELEHLLQNLEAKKFLLIQQQQQQQQQQNHQEEGGGSHNNNIDPNLTNKRFPTPFSQFFGYPQYTCSQISNNNKHTLAKTKASIADIEVTLIETHANLRILTRKRLTQLSKMVACFQTLYLSILHLNVTTLEPLVLYSISVKVEEGCGLNSADDIAGAVHQMLRIIEDEATTPYDHAIATD